MKSDISSLELHYLLDEFKPLIGGKVEQIYQLGKEEMIFQLHVPNLGKSILRCILGKFIYIASSKGDMPDSPPGFCLFLRRKLRNARLRSITQLAFERAVEFVFETKEAKFRLIIEVFSKGNVILCDEKGIILSALENQEWKDRSIKPKSHYNPPKKDLNFLELKRSDLEFLSSSDKESVVKSLAIELSLGGVYAEELCIMAKIDKTLKPTQLSDKERSSLFDACVNLRSRAISPLIVYGDSEKNEVKDVVAFPLEFYKNLESVPKDSFNSALDSVLTTKLEAKAIAATEKVAKTKIDKINDMMTQQKLRIEGLEKSGVENQRKAESIYENYVLVQQILAEINDLRKKMSWDEVKKHFAGHKIIVSIDEKKGEVVVEL